MGSPVGRWKWGKVDQDVNRMTDGDSCEGDKENVMYQNVFLSKEGKRQRRILSQKSRRGEKL